MALVKCPECGRDRVSSFAVACPECGFNIKAYFEGTINEEKVEAKKEEEKEEVTVLNTENTNQIVENIQEQKVEEEIDTAEVEIAVEELGYSRYQVIWDTMVSSIFIALGCSFIFGFIAATASSPEYFLASYFEGFITGIPFFIMIISNILLSRKGIKAYSLAGKLFKIIRKTAKGIVTIFIVKAFIFLVITVWEVVIFGIFLFFSAPITVLYYAIMYLAEKKVEFDMNIAEIMDKTIPVVGCIVTTIIVFSHNFL